MYIFLDESYNLKDRSKPQFISISGFKTIIPKPIHKHWKIFRRRFISKARIHATDKRFESLREKSIDLIYYSQDTSFITVIQTIQEIPADKASFYYRKGKLDFEKVYEDLVKALLDKYYVGQEIKFLEKIRAKTIQIKNPLGKPRG